METFDEYYRTDEALLALCTSDPVAHEGGPSELWAKLACGRKYHLDRQFPEDSLAESAKKRNIGIIAHKITEILDRGLDPAEYVTKSADNPRLAEALHTAWRIGDRYAAEFPLGFWGKMKAAELKLRDADGNTGRIDRIWEMDEAVCARIEARFAVNMNGPGAYVWDLKTSGQKDSSLAIKYEWAPATYMYGNLAFKLGFPNLRGLLFLNAVPYVESNTKADWFNLACYPIEGQQSPNAHARFALLQQRAAANIASAGACNIANCFFYGSPCRHRLTGACDGV